MAFVRFVVRPYFLVALSTYIRLTSEFTRAAQILMHSSKEFGVIVNFLLSTFAFSLLRVLCVSVVQFASGCACAALFVMTRANCHFVALASARISNK